MLAEGVSVFLNGDVKKGKQTSEGAIRKREWIFVSALIVSMVIATGPGVLLVNRPETVLGFPSIYVWGVVWYLVIAGLAVATDRLVWSKDCGSEDSEDAPPES